MSTPDVPAALARQAVLTWGESGRRWIEELPGLCAQVAGRWGLEFGDPMPMSYHWVAAVTRADGSAAVLKLGVPGAGHLAVEAAALRAFDGYGAVRLLESDEARGALLLERADPGTPAAALVGSGTGDEEATAAILAVARRLHRVPAVDCPLPDLVTQRRWFRAYLRRHPQRGPLPGHLVRRADRLFEELCAGTTERVLLVRAAEASGLPQHAVRLAFALWSFYYIAKRREDWLTTSDIGLRCARVAGDRVAEGALLAEVYARTGDHLRALDYFAQAIAAHTDAGNEEGRAGALLSLGHSQTALGQSAAARESWRAAHAVFVALDRPEAEQTRVLLGMSAPAPARRPSGVT